MAYCRWSDKCDVYVYLSADGFVTHLVNSEGSVNNYLHSSASDCANNLIDLKNLGYKVPDTAIYWLKIEDSEDEMQELIDSHRKIQDLLGVPRGLEGSRESALGLVRESVEVLEEVLPGYRPWVSVSQEKADKEAIDVFCFLLAYFVSREWTGEEVVSRYLETHNEIIARIKKAT